MVSIRKFCLFILFLCVPFLTQAKLPQLTPAITSAKIDEIMKEHASYQSLNKDIVKRALQNYLEELDPNKTYFIQSDIEPWTNPSDTLLEQILDDYKNSRFPVFEEIHSAMAKAIVRRRALEKQISIDDLPKHVNSREFKDMKWLQTDQELLARLERIKALQIESSTKLNEEVRDKALQRISKHQIKYEDDILDTNPEERQLRILTNVLKATASALDAHTMYFTPDEAQQFVISVQQRLFGIGVQLRDDLNGFTVVKVIDGGPAAKGKDLKAKDRIIAVNGEPVVGMDITAAVELIRGEKNTPAKLTIVREKKEGDTKIGEETFDFIVMRDEVVFKEMRYESSYEPYGDGVIAYLRLYSFYQDPESSSAADLTKELEKIQKEHQVKGVVLDLRYNSGGLLAQAVDVAGLFMTKGIVVSIKDNTGAVQHLRDLDGKAIWSGPLIVLVNRASASASEIVAQTLQDYGRALIVGDDHTFGKGSFQTFTLNTTKDAAINPQGEYKVTRGRYYTVSGKTPQLTGVLSDVVVPGGLSETEIGEKFAKYPLANDRIKENFDDDLLDVPFTQRAKIKLLYKFDLQPKLAVLEPLKPMLQKNSTYRIENNKNYQNFLKEVKKAEVEDVSTEHSEEDKFGENDLQLTEAYNIMKDMLVLLEMPKKAA